MKTPLETAKAEALKLIRQATSLLLNAETSGEGRTSYARLPDRERQMADCLALAQTLGEPPKPITLSDYGTPPPSRSGIRTPSDNEVKKWGRQNLRISKAVNRMSKKGHRCPRG